MKESEIKEVVLEALKNAKNSGYDLKGMSDEHLAEDLKDLVADLEECDLEQLTEIVSEVRLEVL